MSQPVVRHGQEEEVEGVGLAPAGGQASLQGGDGFGVPASPVQDDAQRVEGGVFVRSQFHGPLGERQRPFEVAPGLGTVGQLPGAVVAAGGQVLLELGLVRFHGQRGLQVGDRGLVLVQAPMNSSPEIPQVGIVGTQADGLIEVGDCLREAVQVGEGMGAMMVGVGVVGIALRARSVALEQRFGGLGEMLEVPGPARQSRPGVRAGAAPWDRPGRLRDRRARPSRGPCRARCLRMARRSQTCTARSRAVLGGDHQPRAVGAEGDRSRHRQRSGLSSRASVRPVSTSTRRRTRLGSTTTINRPSGEKELPTSVIRRSSRQVPTSQSRQRGLPATSHFPSGLKATQRATLDGQVGDFPAIADAPDLGAAGLNGCRSPAIARPG